MDKEFIYGIVLGFIFVLIIGGLEVLIRRNNKK